MSDYVQNYTTCSTVYFQLSSTFCKDIYRSIDLKSQKFATNFIDHR